MNHTKRNTVVLNVLIIGLGLFALHASLGYLAELEALGARDPGAGLRELATFAHWLGGAGIAVVLAGGAYCLWQGRRLRARPSARDVRGRRHAPRRARGRLLTLCGVVLSIVGAGGLLIGVGVALRLT